MIVMKHWIFFILSVFAWVAFAEDKPTPEALAARFREHLHCVSSFNNEVIQTLGAIEDEASLKQVSEQLRKMHDRLERMSQEVDAFKKELERLNMKAPDLPGGESLMSDFRHVTLQQKMKLSVLVKALNARLEKGDFGDPAQAVALMGRGIPVLFNDYEDDDKKHADTVMRMQRCVMQCEMAVMEFSTRLMGIKDEESADEAAGFVVYIKSVINDLQMQMDMYALDDPLGYEPIRESIEERIKIINDVFVSTVRHVLSKDCYGSTPLQAALQDYIAE